MKGLLQLEAKMPTRATDGAVGYDLSSITKILIQPHDRCLVPTGLVLQIPLGMYGRIAPRSGLALEHGIHVGAGVIDPDYRGEVKVLLFNLDDKLLVSKGSITLEVKIQVKDAGPISGREE